MVNTFSKFGFSGILTYKNGAAALPGTIAYPGHHHHVHLQGFNSGGIGDYNSRVSWDIDPITPSPLKFSLPSSIAIESSGVSYVPIMLDEVIVRPNFFQRLFNGKRK